MSIEDGGRLLTRVSRPLETDRSRETDIIRFQRVVVVVVVEVECVVEKKCCELSVG